jgi:site-specific DNA-methyltransferase (adenine-specific)
MTPYHVSPGLTVYHGDALTVYSEFPDSAFGLLWLDPPYYKVKMECAWDRQWLTPGAFLDWLRQHAAEWQRLLAPNGSLYVCASPQMAWEVEGVLRKQFNVASRIVWEKQNGWHQKQNKEEMRQYNDSMTEIIFFCEHYGADNIAKGEAGWDAKCDELRGFVFEPIRAYIAGEFERAGMLTTEGKIAANVACGFSASSGGMASRHYFSQSQWQLPTPEHYEKLRALLNRNGSEYLRREYEDLRRPFFATPDRPFTSVWHYETVQAYAGKHPAEKPYAMVRDVVLTSSREDMLCGDFFAGSGVFGRACRDLGRRVVLCDQAEEWTYKATQRAMGPPLLRLLDQPAPAPQPQQAALDLREDENLTFL